MTKEELFRFLVQEHRNQEEFIDRLPSEISNMLVDNCYTNSLMKINARLVDAVFKEYAYDVNWFLYEWKPGFEIVTEEIESKIYSLEDYIDWLKQHTTIFSE